MRFSVILVAMILASGPVFADAQGDALALINDARAKAGCAALTMQPQLQAAAKGHATAMAVKNFFSHTGKNGSKMVQRIKAAGYRGRKLAENIAAGQKTPQAAVQAWLDSPGHRRNMLDCDFSETGLAMVYQADDAPLAGNAYAMKYYWVQTFGQR